MYQETMHVTPSDRILLPSGLDVMSRYDRHADHAERIDRRSIYGSVH